MMCTDPVTFCCCGLSFKGKKIHEKDKIRMLSLHAEQFQPNRLSHLHSMLVLKLVCLTDAVKDFETKQHKKPSSSIQIVLWL